MQSFRLLTLIFLINSLISPNNFVIVSQAKSSEIDVGSIYSYNISNSEFKTSIEGSGPVISINDQKISPIWDNISGFDIESFENGIIKSAYGKNTIYFLITHPLDLKWVAIEWDSDHTGYDNIIPMQADDDLWVFGTTLSYSYGDSYSVGQGIKPVQDDKVDLQWEKIIVNDSSSNQPYVAWEFQRNFLTNDTEGRDVQFDNLNASYSYPILFASNHYHKLVNKISKGRFYFSNLTLGSSVPVNISTSGSKILVDRFFYSQIIFGLSIGIFSMIAFFYLPVYINKRRK